ncbi:rRNA methyltransferase, partial [Propionibacterium freudenreichii]|nr:rRNA methyltransferase [Propionibacterium freudenreichii]
DEFAARMRARPGKLAILMGTEGAGLSGHWISQADAAVRIPMAHGIDSLNVAAAAAVACYALRP